MALSSEAVNALQAAIAEGAFPDSEQFLTANILVGSFPLLLRSISQAKNSLLDEVREVSKEQAGGVDIWIVQAKKAQDEIARCKLEARQIVEEHERVEALKSTTRDANRKVQLLEEEISFNRNVQHELELISEVAQVLDEASHNLSRKQPIDCVNNLVSTRASIQRVPSLSSQNLLAQIDSNLRHRAGLQLREVLDEACIVVRNDTNASLEFRTTAAADTADRQIVSVEHALEALTNLDLISEGAHLLLAKLERFLLPLLSKKVSPYTTSVNSTKGKLNLQLGSYLPNVSTFLGSLGDVFQYLHTSLPQSGRNEVIKVLVPRIVSLLIEEWLNEAVPFDLNELKIFESLEVEVKKVANQLSSFSWPGHQELNDWIDQIPRTWLNKRRMTSLDAVRAAMRIAAGNTRQVERVERQMVERKNDTNIADEDDWNAAWDDEQKEEHSESTNGQYQEDDDTGGWDFETDDTDPDIAEKSQPDQENEAVESWGWGDDTPADDGKVEISFKDKTRDQSHKTPAKDEIVLKELYSITEIPDYILEVIGRDIVDSQTLKSSPDASIFSSAAPIAALQALPTLTLAMFRATAPTNYSHARKLSNMNLYNDTLYMTQKVSETATDDLRSTLQPAIDTMAKFARQVYTRELDIQRTILSDLLDGAQGFVSCNSDQYRELSASAVSAVVDRIRHMQQEYQNVLGQSHLLQTIGALVTMVIGKIISDIEDLEDISEKESIRLVGYCQHILSLEDLFMATGSQNNPAPTSVDDFPENAQQVSTIVLYVPNYFRFQYLTEILKSSLADIKFMWTEGGLKSDFSSEEVIDLINALFAESNHRRSAISAIRASG